MTTFAQYQARYEAERERLEDEFARLSMQEKSRRALGRDNPLLYSSRAVADTLGRQQLSPHSLTRDLDRQTGQLEHIAHQTLVLAPLRRLHRSTEAPGQRWPGRRAHVDSTLLSYSRQEQGGRGGRSFRAGQMDHRSRDHQRRTPFRLVLLLEPRVPPGTVAPDAQPELRRSRLRYDALQGLDTQSRRIVGRLR